MLKELTYEEFARLSVQQIIIPVYRQIYADQLTAISIYSRICSGKDGAFLIENMENNRYTYFGRNPFLVLRLRGNRIQVEKRNETFVLSDNPLETIRKFLSKYRTAKIDGLPPFVTGMIGYFAFDAYRWFQDAADPYPAEDEFDDALLMFFSTVLVYDHWQQKLTLINNIFPDRKTDLSLEDEFDRALDYLDKLENNLLYAIQSLPDPVSDQKPPRLESKYEAGAYRAMVKKVQDHIQEEKLSHITLTNRLRSKFDVPPFNLYRMLRLNNSGSHSLYLHHKHWHLMGFCHQPYLQVQDGVVFESFPSDTAGRSSTMAPDSVDPENCRPAILEPVLKQVGKLANSEDALDILFRRFPPPLSSGQPQPRALELIDTIEEHRRGAIGGVIAYLDYSGNFNAVIPAKAASYHRHKFSFDTIQRITAETNPAQLQARLESQTASLSEVLEYVCQMLH